MRTAWNIVSFLAVVNLLALLGFVGWLWQSDRLSTERIEELRTVLATTNAQDIEQARDAAAVAQQVQAEQHEQARRSDPPMPAPQQIAAVNLVREQQQRAIARLEDERDLLLAQLDGVHREYEDSQQTFQQQQQQWYASIEDDRQRKQDEQFQQALKLYESIPPKQAQAMMTALVADGAMQQAVAYLDAMNARAASKIIREFKTAAETELAKQLLEELRTFGVLDAESQDESNERTVASAADPTTDPQR